MKIMTVLGTRPEIIRLSRIIARLDDAADHLLVYTGQNFDYNLRDIFFRDLAVRAPDEELKAVGSFADQLAIMLTGCEKLVRRFRPQRLLVLGDTNSVLSAISAKRQGVAIYNLEAGNRCYDERVPEEVNRRIIDHLSDVRLPYTERSRANLLREGIPGDRVFVTGNPIYEVLCHYEPQIAASDVLSRLNLKPRRYFLVTMHRAENVDIEDRLRAFIAALDRLQREYNVPVIVSTHPRTRNKLSAAGIAIDNPEMHFLPPFGFFDFVALERNAMCVLSDSGTVQEECAIFQVPVVTIRDVTERPETIECGSNILSGADPDLICGGVRYMLSRQSPGTAPPEYLAKNVSETVLGILLGYRHATSSRGGA